MDRQTIVDAAATDFQPLIGMREAQDFEAKRQWPNLTLATAKWEFAKDVSAMANGGGGVILFGLATQKMSTEQSDITSAVYLLDAAAVNVEMAKTILDNHISPRLRDVRVEFIEAQIQSPKGIVLLEVPGQPSKVFLCKVMEGTESMKEYLFGFAERDRDRTRNWNREDVMRMIRSGTDSVSARLEAIEQVLGSLQAQLVANAPSAPTDDAVLEARIEEILRHE